MNSPATQALREAAERRIKHRAAESDEQSPYWDAIAFNERQYQNDEHLLANHAAEQLTAAPTTYNKEPGDCETGKYYWLESPTGHKFVAFYRKEFDTWDMGVAYKTAHLVDKGYLFGPEAIEKDALESPPQVGWVGLEEVEKFEPDTLYVMWTHDSIQGDVVSCHTRDGESFSLDEVRACKYDFERIIKLDDVIRLIPYSTPKEPRDE